MGLVKKIQRVTSPILAQEDAVKDRIYEPGGRTSPDTKFAGDLILVFSTSRMVRNKILPPVSHPVCGVLLQQPQQTK